MKYGIFPINLKKIFILVVITLVAWLGLPKGAFSAEYKLFKDDIGDEKVILDSYFCQTDGEVKTPKVLSVGTEKVINSAYYEIRYYKVTAKSVNNTTTSEDTKDDNKDQVEPEETKDVDNKDAASKTSNDLGGTFIEGDTSASVETSDSSELEEPKLDDEEINIKEQVLTLVSDGEFDKALELDPEYNYKEVKEIIYPGEYRVVVFGLRQYSGYAFAEFSVIGKPQDLDVAYGTLNKVAGDKSVNLEANATGDGTGISYSSSNPEVVSVSSDGDLKFLKAGYSTINVKTTGNTLSQPAKTTVRVTVKPKKPSWVSKGAVTKKIIKKKISDAAVSKAQTGETKTSSKTPATTSTKITATGGTDSKNTTSNGQINDKSVAPTDKATEIESLRVTLKWNNSVTTGETYEIQYSVSPKFTSKSTKTVKVTKNASKVQSKSISGLKLGRKYYIRIRSVSTFSDSKNNVTKLYSSWSTVKSLKS